MEEHDMRESARVRTEERRARPETVGYDEEHFKGASAGQATREENRQRHERELDRYRP